MNSSANSSFLKPELTVAAVVEQRGRFLMIEEEVHGRVVLNQPAGHVEVGETLREAVVRETLEESAWHFRPRSIVGVYLWDLPGSHRQYLRVAFHGQVSIHDADRELDDGIIRALWLTRDEIVARHAQLRSPMVQQAIDDYVRGTRYPRDMFQQIQPEQLATRAQVV